jgi:hypothetical protein
LVRPRLVCLSLLYAPYQQKRPEFIASGRDSALPGTPSFIRTVPSAPASHRIYGRAPSLLVSAVRSRACAPIGGHTPPVGIWLAAAPCPEGVNLRQVYHKLSYPKSPSEPECEVGTIFSIQSQTLSNLSQRLWYLKQYIMTVGMNYSRRNGKLSELFMEGTR